MVSLGIYFSAPPSVECAEHCLERGANEKEKKIQSEEYVHEIHREGERERGKE